VQQRSAVSSQPSASDHFGRPAFALPRLFEKPSIAPALEELLGGSLTFGIEAFDGTRAGPASANTKVVVRTPRALRYIAGTPGELGFARAYVAGDLEIQGDIYDVVREAERLRNVHPSPHVIWSLLRAGGAGMLRRPTPPAEEIRLRGKRHTRARDAAAIAHHYDVSNEFYRLVLGPSMTYSCAVFRSEDDTLEQAQTNKLDLVCRKLGLRPGMRFLDIGCGWGSLVMHAAKHFGVYAVGVTVSREQAAYAERLAYDEGIEEHVAIRHQDYREVADGPYDAIASIGMFEHVGAERLDLYLSHLLALLLPGGRLLNHGVSRGHRMGFARDKRAERNGFIDRYVFPDSELHEVGRVVSAIQTAGFEVGHVEGLRDHYALTLRHWVANLEKHWDRAVRCVGANRARVWRLYMAGSAIGFESNRTSIHQVLAVRPTGDRTHLPLRPNWERNTTTPTSASPAS
jgi:cyclopropane-fatty-acyl-phospholipid synthase